MYVGLSYPQITKFFKNILCVVFFHQKEHFEHLRPKKFKKKFFKDQSIEEVIVGKINLLMQFGVNNLDEFTISGQVDRPSATER